LEPLERDGHDIRAVFAGIDRPGGADFLPEGWPAQPPMLPMPPGADFEDGSTSPPMP
jgi:hypothetical protein